MPERALKHYEAYLERLFAFAKATGVKIRYDENQSSEGVWMPSIRKIKLDTDLSQSGEIASLLHELGHSLDDMLSTPAKLDEKLYKAYDAMYKDTCTKKQRALVVACEERAWNNGRDIANRLRIRLGKWYDQAEKYCLDSYKNN